MTTFRIAMTLVIGLAAVSLGQVPPVQDQIFSARDKVLPALVHIQPVRKDYRTGELKKQEIIGSGVIFHPEGYVITNYHVAGRAERIICTLHDREQVPAEFVGGDPPTDIAVLKLNLDDYEGQLQVAELGDSDPVEVGQLVLAMGSPLALARSVSFGVVSTKDRYFSPDYHFPSGEQTGKYSLWIQTDAAINPGNSGGPLVDLSGRVIGVNTRAAFLANNIGFSIPVNTVKEVAEEIIANGSVTRSWIGVYVQALQELEDYFGTDRNGGVLVAYVDAGSPAEEADLQAGDIVLEMDGQPVSVRYVEEIPSFYSRIAKRVPGSVLDLKVRRNGEIKNLQVTTKSLGELQGDDVECPEWGFVVKAITQQMSIRFQLKDTLGAYVVGVKRVGPADNGGLRAGDVIKRINREEVKDLDSFTSRYEQLVADEADKVLLTILRGSATRLVVINTESRQDNEIGTENE